MAEALLSGDGSGDDEAWTHSDENLAALIDRLDFWLTQSWAQWTTDPDDPEVRKRRLEQKRDGVKPPPIPIIPPIARRPEAITAAIEQWNTRLSERFAADNQAGKKPGESPIDTLDRILG